MAIKQQTLEVVRINLSRLILERSPEVSNETLFNTVMKDVEFAFGQGELSGMIKQIEKQQERIKIKATPLPRSV